MVSLSLFLQEAFSTGVANESEIIFLPFLSHLNMVNGWKGLGILSVRFGHVQVQIVFGTEKKIAQILTKVFKYFHMVSLVHIFQIDCLFFLKIVPKLLIADKTGVNIFGLESQNRIFKLFWLTRFPFWPTTSTPRRLLLKPISPTLF